MPSPPIASNIKSLLYDEGVRVPLVSAVYGLGGREPTVGMVRSLLEKLAGEVKRGGVRTRSLYLGYGGRA
jgi:pyruvate/2-oxoacid:ferredoxin oxidoreductase alpha subunit